MATRKNNGDGTIYQISENKWCAAIQIGLKPNGKPNKKQFTARTQAEVKRKLREYKSKMGLHSQTQLLKRTLSEYYDKWLELKEAELKPLSYQRLVSTIDTHIKPKIGMLQFATIETADIQDLITELQKTKSYSTVKKVYDALNAIFKYDLSLPPTKRLAQYNPCSNIIINRKSAKTTPKIKTFTDEQLTKIKAEIERITSKGDLVYPYGQIYILMFNTGCRMGEILPLLKTDIDVSKRTMDINKNAVQTKEKIIVQDTLKTFSGSRIISLNDGAISAIEKLNAVFPNTSLLAENSNGKMVSPQNCERTFKQILKKCGIVEKGLGCHALRHTFATKLFEKGVDVKIVSEILGHKSTSVTYNTYISVIQRQKAEAVNKIPNL